MIARPSALNVGCNKSAGPAARLVLCASLLAASLAFSGCEKKKPPPPPPPKPKPVIVEPDPVDIDPLLQVMHADARVQFPQAHAPTDEAWARAVITLVDSFAKGDADTLRPLLDSTSRTVLDELIATDDWSGSTSRIEAVRVVGCSSTAGPVRFAIQEPGGAYLLGFDGSSAGGDFVFSALPIPDMVLPRASDWDTASVDVAGPTLNPDDLEGIIPGSEAPEAEAPATPELERPPGRKSTPGGPIDVPTGPGDGG